MFNNLVDKEIKAFNASFNAKNLTYLIVED
jgi:hypothetical protein